MVVSGQTNLTRRLTPPFTASPQSQALMTETLTKAGENLALEATLKLKSILHGNFILLAAFCAALAVSSPSLNAQSSIAESPRPAVDGRAQSVPKDNEIISPSEMPESKSEEAPLKDSLQSDLSSPDTTPQSSPSQSGAAAAAYVLGQRLESNGQFEEALKYFNDAAKADPDYLPITFRRVLLLYRTGKLQEGLKLARTEAKRHADQVSDPEKKEVPRLNSLLAYGYIVQEDYEQAEKFALKAVRGDRDLITNYRVLSEIYFKTNRGDQIIDLFRESTQHPLSTVSLHMRLGEQWYHTIKQNGIIDQSTYGLGMLRIYRHALKIEPRHPVLCYRAGAITQGLGKNKLAAKYFEKGYHNSKRIEDYRERYLSVLLRLNRFERASQVSEDILQQDPSKIDLRRELVNMYRQLHQYDDAIFHLKHITKSAERKFKDFMTLASVYLINKDADNSVATANDGLQAFPKAAPLALIKSIALRSQEKYDLALGALDEAESLGKERQKFLNSQFYFEYAVTYEKAKRYTEAEVMFQKSLKLDPENHEALNYLGYMWAEQDKNLIEAETMVKKALVIKPNSAAYLDSLGWVYYKQGKYQQAVEWLFKAITKEPNDPTLNDHIGDAYFKLGETDLAIAAWKTAFQNAKDPSAIAAKVKDLTGHDLNGRELSEAPATPVTGE